MFEIERINYYNRIIVLQEAAAATTAAFKAFNFSSRRLLCFLGSNLIGRWAMFGVVIKKKASGTKIREKCAHGF